MSEQADIRGRGLGRELRFWAIAVVVFFLAVYVLRDILLPFVAGMAIAYLLDPVCDWLEKKGLSRTLATSLLTLGFVLLALGATGLGVAVYMAVEPAPDVALVQVVVDIFLKYTFFLLKNRCLFRKCHQGKYKLE